MKLSTPFDRYADDYDAWFDTHPTVFESEVEAIRELMPEFDAGVDIGAGTGRFAEALGVEIGVEPSAAMRELARRRGIDVVDGRAEKLPFDDGTFDLALMITVDCFLDDIPAAFQETRRVLQPGGAVILGMLDRGSNFGRTLNAKENSRFFGHARLHSADQMARALRTAGFRDLEFRQTLFGDPELLQRPDVVRPGMGNGGFVVIRGNNASRRHYRDR